MAESADAPSLHDGVARATWEFEAPLPPNLIAGAKLGPFLRWRGFRTYLAIISGITRRCSIRQSGTHMAFNQKKVAQVAAWFVTQDGGSLTILKLMKLMYLADRQALTVFDRTISGDRMVSMPNGPVLSQSYELANGGADECVQHHWDAWLCDRSGREISVQPDRVVSRETLTEISDAEFAVLETVQAQFGSMTANQLRNYTHANCPEWKDPDGSSRPIPLPRVLKAMGKTSAQIDAIAKKQREERALDAFFATL